MADQPKVYSEQTRRARKIHRCCECGAHILPKTNYNYVSGIWDAPASFRQCLECKSAIKTIDAFFEPLRRTCGYLNDDDFAFSLGGYFGEARDLAWELRDQLQPGQYFRVLKERVKAQRRHIAATEATGR